MCVLSSGKSWTIGVVRLVLLCEDLCVCVMSGFIVRYASWVGRAS